MTTRNEPLRFARFTWENFEFIEQAAKDNPGLHPATQLVLSLLGLVVFQHEKNRIQFDKKARATRLATLDWPRWTESEPTDTVGRLVERLRHAVAHGGVTFSSDSRNLTEVVVTFALSQPDWTGTIKADDLRTFCYRFKTFLDQIGG